MSELVDDDDDGLNCNAKIIGKWKANAYFMNGKMSGLYKYGSMMNHSCVPNVKHSVNRRDQGVNKYIHYVARRDINKGEILFTSYLSEKQLCLNSKKRNKLLKQFMFDQGCFCIKCKNETKQSLNHVNVIQENNKSSIINVIKDQKTVLYDKSKKYIYFWIVFFSVLFFFLFLFVFRVCMHTMFIL